MTAASPACWNCRRPDGCAAIACAPSAKRIRRRSTGLPTASLSRASNIAASTLGLIARKATTSGSRWGLREGKNREIKRVLEHLGLQVNRLIRISYGPFQLAELGEGAIEEVRTRVLKDQLGEKLAHDAEVDFDAPVFAIDSDRTPARSRTSGSRGQARDRPGGGGGRAGRGAANADAQAPAPQHSAIRQRKHVSTLRAERTGDDRKRVSRTKTEDRRGREIPVERITLAGKQASAPPGSRNGRRFAGERNGDGRRPQKGDGRPFPGDRAPADPAAATRPARIRSDGGDARAFRGAAKPRFERGDGERPDRARRGSGDARPPRRDERSPPSSGDKPRFDKRDGARPDRMSNEARDARPHRRADRAAKAFSDKPRLERRDGPSPGGPSRGDGGKPRFNRSERPARPGGDKPPGPRPAGDRPHGGGPTRGSFRPGSGGGKPPSRGKR